MNKLFKKLFCVSFVVILALSLVSCGDVTSVEIKSNGSGVFYSKTSISEAELNKAKDILTNEPNSETAKFLTNNMNVRKDNIDDYIGYIKESYKAENTSSGVVYYKEEKVSFNNGSELNDPEEPKLLNAGATATDIHWTADKYDAKKIELGWNKLYTIKMPYKVTKTNGNKKDDYTVEFNNCKDKFLYVITEKSTADWTKATDIYSALQKIDNEKTVEAYRPLDAGMTSVNYNTKKSLKISFTAMADKFIIQRKVGNGKWQDYKTMSSTTSSEHSFVDKNIKPNKKYSYRVKCVNYIKDSTLVSESEFTKPFSITTMNFKTKPVIKSVKVNKNKVVVKIKKKVPNATGYQIQYSGDKKFKKATKTIKTKKLTQNIKKMNVKKHYVRVRTYKKVGNKYFYGSWSKTSIKK